MQNWKIPLYKIYWNERDIRAITKVIKRGALWTGGPEVAELERTVANYIGAKCGVSFNSGTSALHALFLALDITRGDEIIVPSFTFIATANAALFVGARPVFADIEEETYGLSPPAVQEKISSKTRVLMPIHYGGLPCKIKELKEIAEDNRLILVEDAAESIGSAMNGKKVGSFSDAAMFSFCGNKVITTGEGGVVVTDSREIYERLMLVRSHGKLEPESRFTTIESPEFIALGYNWRMSSITAALGISQMKKLDKLIEMRRRNAYYLTTKLSGIPGIKVQNPPNAHFHVYQMYTIRVMGGKDVRNALGNHLARKGIMTKVYFDPVHLTHFYRNKFGYREGELPITEEISREVLTLPMYPTLRKKEMGYIANNIRDFMEKMTQ